MREIINWRIGPMPGGCGMKNCGILLCHCSGSDLIDPIEATKIRERMMEFDLRFVLDHPCLCSKDTGLPVLSKLAEMLDKVIVVGCHERAQRWLFEGAVEMDKLIPINVQGSCAEEVVERLTGMLRKKEGTKAEWFPVIDKDRCSECGQCLDFCLFGTFDKDEEGRIYVKNPYNCKDNCPACARVCPEAAIIFPRCSEDWVAGADVARPEYKKLSRHEIIEELKTKRGISRARGKSTPKKTKSSLKGMIGEIAGED